MTMKSHGSVSVSHLEASVSADVQSSSIDPGFDKPRLQSRLNISTHSWSSLFAFHQRADIWLLLAAILSSTAVAALRTSLAVILGRIFDIVVSVGGGYRSGQAALETVSKWCLVLAGLGLGDWFANTAFSATWILYGELQADCVRNRVFQSLILRDLAWFDKLEQGMPALLSRTQTQIRELRNATSQVFGLLVCDAVTSCASLAIALYHSWRITLLLLATLPPSVIILSLASRKIYPAIQAQKEHLEHATKLAAASTTAADLVKVFDGLDRELEIYQSALRLAGRSYKTQARCSSIEIGYIAIWVVGLFVLGFWYGNFLIRGGLSPGHVVTTLYSILAAFQGVEASLPHWLVLARGSSAGAYLSSIAGPMDTPVTKVFLGEVTGAIPRQDCVGNVRFDDVTFAYPSNPAAKILNASSLYFPAGQLTFIVGRSGSGKSTIGNLLAKLYVPSSGQILVDEQPLDSLDDGWIRENITLIQQSTVLFRDSLFCNIALGSSNPGGATLQEVLNACQATLLQSTVACLPQGLYTPMGTLGVDLSGGEKQKVALARAWLRNPTVLILDEVTSGIDQVGRAQVIEAIRKWRWGKTTIIITHDIPSIGDDDYVYGLSNGSVVTKGYKRDLPPFFPQNDSTPSKDAALEPRDPSLLWSEALYGLNNRTDRTGAQLARSPSATAFIDLASTQSGLSANVVVENPSTVFEARSGMTTPLSLTGDLVIPSTPVSRQRWSLVLDAEVRRFSAFVTGSFCQRGRRDPDEKQQRPTNFEFNRDISLSDVFEKLSHSPFIFGSAQRRQNISKLRRRQAAVAPFKDASTLTGQARAGKVSLTSMIASIWPTLGRADKLTLIFGILFCLVRAFSTPAFAFCLSQLMESMWSAGGEADVAHKWAIYLMIVGICEGFSTGGAHYMMEKVGQAWVDGTRIRAHTWMLRQPRTSGNQAEHSPGRFADCLERNAEEMRLIVGRFVPTIVAVFSMMTISIVWALVISWKLTLVALAPVPVILIINKCNASISRLSESKYDDCAKECSAVFAETLLSIRVVRALALERYFSRKHEQSARRVWEHALKRAKHTSWWFGLSQCQSYITTALVFYYSTSLLARGIQADVARVLQVVNLLLFSIGNSAEIIHSIPHFAMAQAAAAPLLQYATLPLERPERERVLQKLSTPLPLRMHKLTFSYPNRGANKVLNGMSLRISSGECIALVGRSGCGKSTIVSLLLGLQIAPSEPMMGSRTPPLSFAGIPSSKVDMGHLRTMTAYVPQNPMMFPATIAENIAYGLAKDSIDRRSENLAQIARALGLHDFIMSLPCGYETNIGDGGLALSGGQAQRLSIARALARRPKLLIMDEPTSALDATDSLTVCRTIARLLNRARASRGELAIVLVTHNANIMQMVDRLVVVENGVRVKEGGYGMLTRTQGPFSDVISDLP